MQFKPERNAQRSLLHTHSSPEVLAEGAGTLSNPSPEGNEMVPVIVAGLGDSPSEPSLVPVHTEKQRPERTTQAHLVNWQ